MLRAESRTPGVGRTGLSRAAGACPHPNCLRFHPIPLRHRHLRSPRHLSQPLRLYPLGHPSRQRRRFRRPHLFQCCHHLRSHWWNPTRSMRPQRFRGPQQLRSPIARERSACCPPASESERCALRMVPKLAPMMDGTVDRDSLPQAREASRASMVSAGLVGILRPVGHSGTLRPADVAGLPHLWQPSHPGVRVPSYWSCAGEVKLQATLS
jgi:hypothetical protein